jgi:hypothetical protein
MVEKRRGNDSKQNGTSNVKPTKNQIRIKLDPIKKLKVNDYKRKLQLPKSPMRRPKKAGNNNKKKK